MGKIDWEKHIEAWRESGVTQAAYCRRHGLSAGYFSQRLRAHRVAPVVGGQALIPVRIEPAASASGGLVLHTSKVCGWRFRRRCRRGGWRSCCSVWADWSACGDLAGGGAGRYAPGDRWFVGHRAAGFGSCALRRSGVRVPQSGRQPAEAAAVGWYRGVVVPTAFARGALRLAKRRERCFSLTRRSGTGWWRGWIGAVCRPCRGPIGKSDPVHAAFLQNVVKPSTARVSRLSVGIMAAMNLASRLDPLNLAAAVKTELEQALQAHIAALQEQAKKT